MREYFDLPHLSIDDLDLEEERKEALKRMYGDSDVDLTIGLTLDPREGSDFSNLAIMFLYCILDANFSPLMQEIAFEQFDRIAKADR